MTKRQAHPSEEVIGTVQTFVSREGPILKMAVRKTYVPERPPAPNDGARAVTELLVGFVVLLTWGLAFFLWAGILAVAS